MKDHVHLVVNVPPKVSLSELMGFLKGKTAIGLFKTYGNLRKKPYWGNHFWSRGYCVTTIGLDDEKIRRYVRYQEEKERLEEREREEPGLFWGPGFKSTARGGGCFKNFVDLLFSRMQKAISMLLSYRTNLHSPGLLPWP
jgi:hypothetical protein